MHPMPGDLAAERLAQLIPGHLAKKRHARPKAAATAQVLATDPPEALLPPCIAAVSRVAVSASISVIAPFGIL